MRRPWMESFEKCGGGLETQRRLAPLLLIRRDDSDLHRRLARYGAARDKQDRLDRPESQDRDIASLKRILRRARDRRRACRDRAGPRGGGSVGPLDQELAPVDRGEVQTGRALYDR